MDMKKSGRLIAKKRKALGLTQRELADRFFVTPQAVSLWEQGKRYPDPAELVNLFKVLDINPIEFLTGLEMYDDKVKQAISGHMRRMDEEVFVAGMVEDGNESYLDLSDFEVVLADENGCPTDRWIPYLDFYNVERPPAHEEMSLPETPYSPGSVYANCGENVLILPVEILGSIGSPRYFNLVTSFENGWFGLKFTDEMEEDGLDIPDSTYDGNWKGIRVFGGEFAKILCKEMGVRRRMDQVEIAPAYVPEERLLVLRLDRARRVNVKISHSEYLLPQRQYDQLWAEDEEQAE